MMKNKTKTIYCLLTTLCQCRTANRIPLRMLMVFAMLMSSSSSGSTLAQNKTGSSSDLPRGNWTVGMHPFLGSGFESIPVAVTSVTTDAKRGIAVTKVGLENTSKQNVTAVKLTWRLSNEQTPNTVILEGQTPYITRDGGLPAGISLVLRFPVVIFAKICQPLVRNGVLDGEFRIDILVSEILFEDGSKWSKLDLSQVKFINAAHHTASANPQGTCGQQACETRTGPGGNVFYTCKASTNNERCSVSPDGFSCTNISCTHTPSSGDYEGYEIIQP
jgi:hypothetical protein